MVKRNLPFCIALLAAVLSASCSIALSDPKLDKFDYDSLEFWLAHPEKKDPADLSIPEAGIIDKQAEAAVDVFYVHSTTFFSSDSALDIESDKKDPELAREIEFHGSIFNGVARVYAPFYRQASTSSLSEEGDVEALEMAYSDVRKAFEKYLSVYSKDRPIIMVGHGQGTYHAIRLLREYFDGKPLGSKLVAAYLPGWFVGEDTFKQIKPMKSAEQTGGFVSWTTVDEGYKPILVCGTEQYKNCSPHTNTTVKPVCANPLDWDAAEGERTPKESNPGSAPDTGLVSSKLEKLESGMVGAVCRGGILWVDSEEFGRWGISYYSLDGDYHYSDFMLFYAALRKNVGDRVRAFLSRN